MMRIERETALAREIFSGCDALKSARIKKLDRLKGDASSRRYLRLVLDNSLYKSLIMMVLSGEKGPLAGGAGAGDQDEDFVALSLFFNRHGLNVPKIIFDAREKGVLLVEDAGDLSLFKAAFEVTDEEKSELKRHFGSDFKSALYKNAVDCIIQLQSLPDPGSCVAFKRYLGFSEYQTESMRFITGWMDDAGFGSDQGRVVERLIEKISACLAKLPLALCHRDFMSWNVHVLEGELMVIDFQDAVMASPLYDLISLLNDRDTDLALGEKLYGELVEYFLSKKQLKFDFRQAFNAALLQRDLRVAGLFCELAKKRPKGPYGGWVPGCLRRIGRSLAYLPDCHDELAVLKKLSPEIAAGAQSRFCEDLLKES